MHLATGAIVVCGFIAVYLIALLVEGQRRDNQMINQHPYQSPYDSARGAARQGSSDATEHTTSRHYARGTR